MNHSADNKRLTKNTLMLYIRMFLVMSISLYTSRVILHALGIDNYGIFNVVGGVIALLGFINSSMSLSVQRFYSFSLGKKNIGDVNELFNLSAIIHIGIAIIVAVFFFAFGSFIIKNYLNIPPGREWATLYFFKFIVISTCMGIMQVPVTALFIAFEKMETFAWISIVEVSLKLVIAFIVKWIDFDPLITYGILISISSIIILSLWVLLAKIKFKEIKYKFRWNHGLFKQLLSFATWSALGEVAWAFTLQGVSVLLNMFWGVVTNAAYGIANQVSGATRQFVNSFQTAINPQIIKRYAAVELSNMFLLTLR